VRARLAQAVASSEEALADEPIRWVVLKSCISPCAGEGAPAVLDLGQALTSARSQRPSTFRWGACASDRQRPWIAGAGDDPERWRRSPPLGADRPQFGFRNTVRRPSTIGCAKDRLSAEGSRRLAEIVRRSEGEIYGTVPVHAIELLKSDLRPSGPVYTQMATLALRG
jgi:hypothetical protein